MNRGLVLFLAMLLPALAYAAPMRYELKLTGAYDNGSWDHTPVSHNQLLPYGDTSNSTSDPTCAVCHQSNEVRFGTLNTSGVISIGSRPSAFFAVPLTIRYYGDTDHVDLFPDQSSTVAAIAPGATGSASGYYLAQGRATLSPVQVAKPLRGIKQVASGNDHGCAVTSSGGVLCWGDNSSGQLGGTGDSSPVPEVVSLPARASMVASGGAHSCALTTAGAVWCWGDNTNGQLGNNSNNQSSAPVAVSGLSSGVRAIAAGVSSTCAIKTDGSVWCWGLNDVGELGNNSTTDSPVPVAVNGLSGVTQISMGAYHACAIATSGSAWCWGLNGDGEVGNNSTANSLVPVPVNGLSPVISIAAGQNNSCAVEADQSVWCWGYNTDGELGNNSTLNSPVPVAVSALPSGSGVRSVSVGGDYNSLGGASCALKADGTVWCWGLNSVGEVGNNSYNNSSVPVAVVGLPAGVVSLAAGVYNGNTCALTRAGGVSCWGSNRHGQLARAGAQDAAAPALSFTSPGTFISASFDGSAGLFVSVDGSHHSIGIGSGWPANVTPTLPGGVLDDTSPCEWEDIVNGCPPPPTFAADNYDLKSAFTMTGLDLINGAFPASWPLANAPLPLVGGGQLILNSATPRGRGQGGFTATALLPTRRFLIYGATRGPKAQATITAYGLLTLGNGANPFNPATDDFVLGFGPYTALLPAGSLTTSGNGTLVFSGGVNGTQIDLSLKQSGSNYEFQMQAQNANITGVKGALDVQFYLGDNAASGTLQSASH